MPPTYGGFLVVGVDGSPESRDAALLGPYSAPGPPITPNFREAPTLLPAPDHKAWYLYYEQYPGVAYCLSTAPKLAGPWYSVYCKKYAVPDGVRHGCIVGVTEKQYDAILTAYGNRDAGN